MSIGTDAKNKFISSEPVIAAHAAAAVVGYVLTALVTHGVITSDRASALTQQVLPAVTAVVLVGLGWLVRRAVSPAAKFADQVEAEVQKRLGGVPAQLLDDGAVAQMIASWDTPAEPAGAHAAEPAATVVPPVA